MSIEHNIELENGSFANTVGPKEQVEAMYPSWQTEVPVYVGKRQENYHSINTPFNGSLRINEVGDELAISGNTVTRLCAVAEDCGSCVLNGSGLTVEQMSEKNCARANTAATFGEVDVEPEARFVLLPLGKESFVVGDDSFTDEYNGDELMQRRLGQSPAVVFTESWLKQNNLSEIAVGMNGADGSMGVATTQVNGERLFIPFCSMRGNMGDRGEDSQILRQALNAYFDSINMSEYERATAIADMGISIMLSASASLENFAHQIQIPSEADDASDREKNYAASLRANYPALIQQAGGKITSAIVLNDQYPGALKRGAIFPQFEAEMGIRTTPITPDNCPGDGQSCHIDYRSETEYALVTQLESMGVAPWSIHYDDSQALDPSAASNSMASNRREQKNGVATAMTTRTINGMKIQLRDHEAEHNTAFNRASERIAIGMIVNMPLSEGMPRIDPDDPFVSAYEIQVGHTAPPRELWNTEENLASAKADGYHPMAYWLMGSDMPDDPELSRLYSDWMRQVSQSKRI